MVTYSLFPTILLPTRVSPHSATIVDNIFTNNLEKQMISGVIETDFSDHYSQFLSIKNSKVDYKSIVIYSRDYSKFSSSSFRDDVSIQNFYLNSIDVNEQFNDFYFKLKGCVDRHAPMKKLNRNEIKFSNKPWINTGLRKMIINKNKLFKRKKRQPNNEDINKKYKEARNQINRELAKSKKNYYASYFSRNQKNSKKTWEGIKSIINTKNPRPTSISQIKHGDKILNNPKEIANSFNKLFTDIGPNTEMSIPKNPIVKPEKFLKNRIGFNFLIAHITNEEVLDIITHLQNKSTGPHSIPIKLLN